MALFLKEFLPVKRWFRACFWVIKTQKTEAAESHRKRFAKEKRRPRSIKRKFLPMPQAVHREKLPKRDVPKRATTLPRGLRLQHFPKRSGQENVFHLHRLAEEGRNVCIGIAGNAAAYAGDEEAEFGIVLCNIYKRIFRIIRGRRSFGI